MGRFETYLRALAEFDRSFHEELQGDLNWLAGKRQQGRENANRQKRKPTGNNNGLGEESSSLEENGTTSGTDLLVVGSEDAGVFPAGLADFMSGEGDAREEFDEDSEQMVKLKVPTCSAHVSAYTC